MTRNSDREAVYGHRIRHRVSGGGSFIVDRQGIILGFDEGMESLTGWLPVEVVGRSRDLLPPSAGSLTEPIPLFDGPLDLRGEGSQRVSLRLGCRDGRFVDVEALAEKHAGGAGRVAIDVLRILGRSGPPEETGATHRQDHLTGLPDLDAFRAELGRQFRVAHAHARPLALMIADVDHLYRLNDRHGRAAGDEILLKIAGILRATVGEEHVVSRLRDDDFAVLLLGSGRGEARQIAARLRSTVEQFPFEGGGGDGTAPRVTISVGAASFPADAETTEDLMSRAHEALEQARSLGRNRVWCYMRRPRVPVVTPVYFDGAERLLLGHSRDLSPSGIFVSTPAPIEIGMRCALTFPLPSAEADIRLVGRVVRNVPSLETEPHGRVPGIGIEFEKVGLGDRRSIDTFLYAHESTSQRPEAGRLSLG